MKNLTILAIALFQTLSWADNTAPHPGQSKEDTRAESQVSGVFTKIVKALSKVKVYKDGSAKFSYVVNSGMDSDPGMKNGIDLTVETWVGKSRLSCGCDDIDSKPLSDREAHVLWFPLEIRMRANLAENSSIELKDFRAGLIRFVLSENVGLTVQALSLLKKKYDYDFGTRRMFEVASATWVDNEALGGGIELVLKANAYFGYGNLESDNQQVNAAVAPYTGVAVPRDGTWNYGGSGSIGVKVKDSVMVDLYAGLDQDDSDNNIDGKGVPETQVPSHYSKNLSLDRKKVGLGFRLKATPSLTAGFSLERNYYDQRLNFKERTLAFVDGNGDGIGQWGIDSESALPGDIYSRKDHADTVMFTLEKKW